MDINFNLPAVTITVKAIHQQGSTPAALNGINIRLDKVMALLDQLSAQVARNTEVDQSAVVLLEGLKAKLDAAINSGDPAALQALSDSLGASTDALAAAMAANTPADPVDPPAEPV